LRTRQTQVLIIGSTEAMSDLGELIARQCGSNVAIAYANNVRAAQRLARQERFVAIAAVDHGYLEFCASLVPQLAMPGSILDLILAYTDYQDAPYGVCVFQSVETAAAEVRKAVNHQIGLWAEAEANARAVQRSAQISAPPVVRNL